MKNSFLLLLLLSGLGCYAQVIPDELVAAWDYEANPHKAYLGEFCQGSIAPLLAEYQAIRAIKNNPDQAGIRLRFTLGKEVYRSVSEAEMAVAKINKPPRRSSKHAKMCDIRQAFNIDHVVYFVHTDVGNFKSEISHIMDKLYKQVQ